MIICTKSRTHARSFVHFYLYYQNVTRKFRENTLNFTLLFEIDEKRTFFARIGGEAPYHNYIEI